MCSSRLHCYGGDEIPVDHSRHPRGVRSRMWTGDSSPVTHELPSSADPRSGRRAPRLGREPCRRGRSDGRRPCKRHGVSRLPAGPDSSQGWFRPPRPSREPGQQLFLDCAGGSAASPGFCGISSAPAVAGIAMRWREHSGAQHPRPPGGVYDDRLWEREECERIGARGDRARLRDTVVGRCPMIEAAGWLSVG